MEEEQKPQEAEEVQETEESRRSQEEAWREVGTQFRALGESLGAAFQAAWHDEQNRRYVEEMQSGLQKMADDVSAAVKDVSVSEQGQRVRDQAKRAAESVRTAGQQTAKSAEPYVVLALREIRDALQKAIDRLDEQEQSVQSASGTEGETPSGGDETE